MTRSTNNAQTPRTLTPELMSSGIKNGELTPVDVMSYDDHARMHIAGSMNVPWDANRFSTEAAKALPNRSQQLALYGPNAKDAARRLSELGYENVHLVDTDWTRAGLPLEGTTVRSNMEKGAQAATR